MKKNRKVTVHYRQKNKFFALVAFAYFILYVICYVACFFAYFNDSIIAFIPTLFLFQVFLLILNQLFPIPFWFALRAFTFGCGSVYMETYDNVPLKKIS